MPHGLLSTDTLGTILERLPSLFLVSLYNLGEPFLHPDLVSIIRTAKSFGMICEISTNMQIMTPELADGLIDSGLDFLRISCDGTTQDAYGAYRKQGDLRKVLDHAELLSERTRERNSKFPIMIFQMVVNRDNEHQADEFPAFAHDNGADVVDVVPLCPMTWEGAEVLKDYEPTDERSGESSMAIITQTYGSYAATLTACGDTGYDDDRIAEVVVRGKPLPPSAALPTGRSPRTLWLRFCCLSNGRSVGGSTASCGFWSWVAVPGTTILPSPASWAASTCAGRWSKHRPSCGARHPPPP